MVGLVALTVVPPEYQLFAGQQQCARSPEAQRAWPVRAVADRAAKVTPPEMLIVSGVERARKLAAPGEASAPRVPLNVNEPLFITIGLASTSAC